VTSQGDLFGTKPPKPTRADQILARFVAWCREHTCAYREIEADALSLLAGHAGRISSRDLAYRARARRALEINDNFTPYLARLLVLRHPQLEELIERRKRPSAESPAYRVDLDRVGTTAPEPDAEQRIVNALAELARVLG
jgi:hypothetical protein